LNIITVHDKLGRRIST